MSKQLSHFEKSFNCYYKNRVRVEMSSGQSRNSDRGGGGRGGRDRGGDRGGYGGGDRGNRRDDRGGGGGRRR